MSSKFIYLVETKSSAFMEIVKKVVLLGHFGVGKTSLVKRFVHQQFSEKYLTTIGVKIDKKLIQIDGNSVKLMLWDIAGESAAIKVPKKYLSGANGIIYVFDMSRKETYQNIQSDLFEINKSLPDSPSVILANKSDLVDESFVKELKDSLGVEFEITSAKTGVNVEETFHLLAKKML